MEKYKLTEIKDKGNYTITYIWHPGIIPKDIPVQQVYGFCNTKDNLVALVREKGDERFTPPGGGAEEGETALETLRREFMEEAQFIPEDIKLLGSLEVINPSAEEEIQKHNLQVRFVCKIGSLDHFLPLKDNETEQRIFVYYKDLPEYIGFINKYTSGKIQYDMYCDYIEEKIEL
ncbi:MAG TPA: NUDIX domain-containing protein [Candidatus Paceibacterota bacterium]|nr:NUDIX domain-containing protein [Candidatus Paceibacterota bacterium]